MRLCYLNFFLPVLRKYLCLVFPVFIILSGCKPVPAGNDIINGPDMAGKELFDYYGCKICHSLTGDKTLYGPPLNDLLNTEIEVIRQGQPQVITFDRDYLFRSIRDPGYEKVRDFQNKAMPESDIPDDRINLIVDYLVFVNKNNLQN